MKILRVNKLTKSFAGLLANNQIDLEVEKGTIFAVIGPNGAGKTTLFNCISGVYKADEGSIFFENEEITKVPPDKVCKLGMARTFQVVKPAENMSALDYVMSGAFCRTWNSKKARNIALETLSFVGFGLYERRNYLTKELTLSNKKALQIASTLATKPKLLMLDEAMAGLTKNEQQDAILLIKKIRDSGITLIVIEHVMEIIMSIADRIAVLNYGEKIADDIPERIVKNPQVITAYLGTECEYNPKES